MWGTGFNPQPPGPGWHRRAGPRLPRAARCPSLVVLHPFGSPEQDGAGIDPPPRRLSRRLCSSQSLRDAQGAAASRLWQRHTPNSPAAPSTPANGPVAHGEVLAPPGAAATRTPAPEPPFPCRACS